MRRHSYVCFPFLSTACAHLDQTGFEFKKRRAVPVIQGVVVAVENEQALLEVRLIDLNVTLCV